MYQLIDPDPNLNLGKLMHQLTTANYFQLTRLGLGLG